MPCIEPKTSATTASPSAALTSLPLLTLMTDFDTLVVGITDENYGQQVAAVVQPRDGARPTLEELQAFLRERLSGYKLPRSLTLVEEIPRHATGKANYPRARELAAAGRQVAV